MFHMVHVSNRCWRLVEEYRTTLFVAAGGVLSIYAILNGMEAFLDIAYPAVQDIFGPAGFILGFLGLFGLYPRLVGRAPMLARTGAIATALGAGGFSVITAWSFARFTGVTSGSSPAWLGIFILLAAVGMILGFLSFAVASLWTDAQSRTVGILLLAPASIFAIMLAGTSIGYTTAWSAFVISAGQALAHLAIGTALRTTLAPTDCEVSSSDVTAG